MKKKVSYNNYLIIALEIVILVVAGYFIWSAQRDAVLFSPQSYYDGNGDFIEVIYTSSDYEFRRLLDLDKREKKISPWEYHLDAINAPQAWQITEGRGDVIVAVIDAGINFENEFLGNCELSSASSLDFSNACNNPNFFWINSKEGMVIDGSDNDRNGYVDDIIGWDFYGNDNHPQEELVTHADYVSAFVNGKLSNIGDRSRVRGVCQNCKVMQIKIENGLSEKYNPPGTFTSQKIANAFRYAVDNGADIISVSLSSESMGDQSQYNSPLVEQAIDYAYDRGVLIVIAAGNRYKDSPGYPAKFTNAMAVGSTCDSQLSWWSCSGSLTGFSNYGQNVEIYAPGDMITPYYGGFFLKGTSFSAPQVSAVAGLMKSVNSDLMGYELRQLLKETATSTGYTDPSGISIKRVNALKAVLASHLISKDIGNMKFLRREYPSDTIARAVYQRNSKTVNVEFRYYESRADLKANWDYLKANKIYEQSGVVVTPLGGGLYSVAWPAGKNVLAGFVTNFNPVSDVDTWNMATKYAQKYLPVLI
jgi:hypothetical protein